MVAKWRFFNSSTIGNTCSIDRVDGRLKVTGEATYAAEFNQPNMAYAHPVRKPVAKGTITGFDTGAAASAAGVLNILTHQCPAFESY